MTDSNKGFPILFLSHGSTMMLGKESVVSRDWEVQGRNAERNGVQGVIILGVHWAKVGQDLHVSIREPPGMNSFSWVAKKKYEKYRITCSKGLGIIFLKMEE